MKSVFTNQKIIVAVLTMLWICGLSNPSFARQCQVGDVISPGQSCTYVAGEANVVFSVRADGSACREGGPTFKTVFGFKVKVNNIDICRDDNIARDDTFNSIFSARKNANGSWRINAVPGAPVVRDTPDLVVESVRVSDTTVSPGERFTLSTTVRNRGRGQSNGTTLRYYRSTDRSISSNDTEVGTDSVSSLGANRTSAESISLTAPTTPGTYSYGACVGKVSNESDTDNNCSTAVSVTVQPPPQRPDLVVESVRVSDTVVSAGERFTLSATVRNSGDGQAPSTTLRYYRSTDATISSRDTQVGTDSVSVLGTNRTGNESISLSAPTSPGTYYYGACVDSITGENDTGNNCSRAVKVSVVRDPPDLVIEAVRTEPATVAPGEKFRLYATLKNQGTAESTATRVRYYRSTDRVITTKDTQLGSASRNPLAPNATLRRYRTTTAPTTPGTYYYGVCVDSVTNEIDTANNCSIAVTLTVTAPTVVAEDVNADGTVDVQDLVYVARRYGQKGTNRADVNKDRVVNVDDMILIAAVLDADAAAPSLHPATLEGLTVADVKVWLSQARQRDVMDPSVRRSILFLEQLLASMVPKETLLLANYPNPFNPETWIPYQLSKPAAVKLTIYDIQGQVVRALDLGHQRAGMYQTRSRAAYWDGKNAFGEPVASGVYFYTLTAGDFSATRKMLIRK